MARDTIQMQNGMNLSPPGETTAPSSRAGRPASRRWIGGLPKSIGMSLAGLRLRAVHGGVAQINKFLFQGTPDPVLHSQLAGTDADVIVAGHAGIPFIKRLGRKTWFNPGVIGMPANDGTPDGWYGLIEPRCHDGRGGLRLSVHRFDDDAAAAAAAMRKVGLAEPYARARNRSVAEPGRAARSRTRGHRPGVGVMEPADRRARPA